ncbi:MAG TPA: amidohydrolase family protein [Pyrinomonadaceae bacterium]|jgi:N-acyl-D-aspartate/D-glutamate deacylase|nr:amidohydrolase family protein [Pyrinomonadaceae bacterium]
MLKHIIACFLLAALAMLPSSSANQIYDVVILNGRVIDPESRLDAVRNIGISSGTIKAVTTARLNGRTVIDAKGLVVAPGFIDLHQHGQNEENYRFKAMDGVTTALELEVGTGDVDRWYAERQGKATINYGVSIGHLAARMAAMHDPPEFLPSGQAAKRAATDAEIAEMKTQLERGLQRGAVAVGFGIQYTPNASHWEILEMFRVAARFGASCHIHMRNAGLKEPASSTQALEEVLAAAAITGAPLHVVHIQSTGGKATPKLLQMIAEARSRKLDVTTECYPYIAGMTDIKSAIFNEGWQEVFGIDYGDLQWAATGERLTKESFERYRKTGGMVAVFSMTEEIVEAALANPLTMIASDGILDHGKGHPRTAGTYTRVLGKYVRERGTLSLMDALRKMTLMPAQRLERRVPSMKNKGRIRVGADADLVVFDASRVIDRSTYEEPAKYAEGVKYLLVNGALVVKDGELQTGIYPGQAVRAPF